jgi:hypothetical protein
MAEDCNQSLPLKCLVVSPASGTEDDIKLWEKLMLMSTLHSLESEGPIATDGQSTYLGVEPHLGIITRYFFPFESYWPVHNFFIHVVYLFILIYLFMIYAVLLLTASLFLTFATTR